MLATMLREHDDLEARSQPLEPAWLGVLKDQIASLRFGSVQVIVHEARVVQIEKTEKVRFDKAEPSDATGSTRILHKP